ncbi:uncharacterized protein LOC121503742 [Cheilinus undulatus]|uniref:uncharacterized protein LOC121503742 n=1 Tax=Cheilinus undulatus TaxID=241271 RepID=UPI001BD63F06|nr:uncharacterized protein LOC121503742 [Cheilinus undulatus]
MAGRQQDMGMSLLSVVEQAIKSCKAEQAKINKSMQLYGDFLRILVPQPKIDAQEPDFTEDDAPDTDTSPGEKEDIELLERALKKALQVRTGTDPSKKDSDRNKLPAHSKELSTAAVKSKEARQTSAASKGNHSSIRSTSKSASLDRKEYKTPGTSSAAYSSKEVKKLQQHVSKSATFRSKNKTIRSNSEGGNTAAISPSSLMNIEHFSQTGESVASSVSPQIGIISDHTAKWKSLRSKQNRLWDKVVTTQRKAVPGRSHFMERMREMFPEDWPHSCPDQTRALVYRLTHQGLDLARQCQTEELLARQTAEARELGGKKNEHMSSLMNKKLLMKAAELQRCAEQTTKEWEAWDRWRPEGGCLCPIGASGMWGDGISAPLPLTVTYTSEAELREVEELRIRVALLQQEMNLEQALLDFFHPQLSTTVPVPGCPNVSVLRDMYSLLGEGGERFPTIVVDSEPD